MATLHQPSPRLALPNRPHRVLSHSEHGGNRVQFLGGCGANESHGVLSKLRLVVANPNLSRSMLVFIKAVLRLCSPRKVVLGVIGPRTVEVHHHMLRWSLSMVRLAHKAGPANVSPVSVVVNENHLDVPVLVSPAAKNLRRRLPLADDLTILTKCVLRQPGKRACFHSYTITGSVALCKVEP